MTYCKQRKFMGLKFWRIVLFCQTLFTKKFFMHNFTLDQSLWMKFAKLFSAKLISLPIRQTLIPPNFCHLQ